MLAVLFFSLKSLRLVDPIKTDNGLNVKVRMKVRSALSNDDIRLSRDNGSNKKRSIGSRLIKSLKFSNKRFDRFILSFDQLFLTELLTMIKNLSFDIKNDGFFRLSAN